MAAVPSWPLLIEGWRKIGATPEARLTQDAGVEIKVVGLRDAKTEERIWYEQAKVREEVLLTLVLWNPAATRGVRLVVEDLWNRRKIGETSATHRSRKFLPIRYTWRPEKPATAGFAAWALSSERFAFTGAGDLVQLDTRSETAGPRAFRWWQSPGVTIRPAFPRFAFTSLLLADPATGLMHQRPQIEEDQEVQVRLTTRGRGPAQKTAVWGLDYHTGEIVFTGIHALDKWASNRIAAPWTPRGPPSERALDVYGVTLGA